MSAPVVIIPARGGSKGIPGKNLRTVGGVSLVGRAVRTARAAVPAARVVIDSDDAAILTEGRIHGAEAPYVRPAHLASDTAGSLAVLQHALAALGIAAGDPRPIVLIQPTSPLVDAAHVAACVAAFTGDCPVVSICACDHHPAWTFATDASGRLEPLLPQFTAVRRQDLPPAWRVSGAVYVASAADLLAGHGFIQPGRTRGVVLTDERAIDIDRPIDLVIAEAILAHLTTPTPPGILP